MSELASKHTIDATNMPTPLRLPMPLRVRMPLRMHTAAGRLT